MILRRASIAPVIVGIAFKSSARILKTSRRIFLEEHVEQNDNRLRDTLQLVNRQRRMQVFVHQLGGGASEWRLAGQHLPKRRAQRVQIRADIDLHSRELLGTGKLWRPDESPSVEIAA